MRGVYSNVPPPSGVSGLPRATVGVASKKNRFSNDKAPAAPAPTKSSHQKNYFDDDDDDDDFPPQNSSSHASVSNPSIDDEYDPLEAFMQGVHEQVTQEKMTVGQSQPQLEIVSAFDAYDDRHEKKAKPLKTTNIKSDGDFNREWSSDEDSVNNEEEEQDAYDSDGVFVGKNKGKAKVLPLPQIDHSTIVYPSFRKRFYHPHPEILAMSNDEVRELRNEIEVAVQAASVGASEQVAEYRDSCPAPIKEFYQSGMHADILSAIRAKGFDKPTAIQAQALPIAMSGSDIIGLAKTGSGKTFSYIWPMIMHVLDQPNMNIGDGPIGLILAPTRELAAQIYAEASAFCKIYNIRICPIFGGNGKWEMQQALKEAPEIVVATPGRLIELIRLKSTNLMRVTMIVLDEADRMFEMGFEYQMRSIVGNTRPDRQTLLFSATMKKKIEGFAREILTDPTRIVVGQFGQANPDIQQVVHFASSDADKWIWLSKNADEFVAEGKVLIFVSSKTDTEDLAQKLRNHFTARQFAIGVETLHGDKSQTDRLQVMKLFSKLGNDTSILVATDIASRGLDIQGIRTVINYNIPKNIETYVHRIGRTGRMGKEGVVPGTAFTLIMPTESSFAVDLVHNLHLSRLSVPPALQRLAESSPRYHVVIKSNRGGKVGPGGIRFANKDGFKPKAMTSAMFSADHSKIDGGGRQCMNITTAFGRQTASSLPAQAPNVDMAANPYIEGRSFGRGKHLTQPAWAISSEAQAQLTSGVNESTSTQFSDATFQLQQQLQGSADQQPKRKSRFSATPVQALDPALDPRETCAPSIVEACLEKPLYWNQVVPPVPVSAPAAAPLRGFVRASSSLSSISSADAAPIHYQPPSEQHSLGQQGAHYSEYGQSNAPSKKSKWG